jgi:hypothetical protein
VTRPRRVAGPSLLLTIAAAGLGGGGALWAFGGAVLERLADDEPTEARSPGTGPGLPTPPGRDAALDAGRRIR